MPGPKRTLPIAALALALMAPAVGHAAPVATAQPVTGSAILAFPAGFRNLNQLNFGQLTVTGAGTAVVNPDTDALTTTGGVVRVGSSAYAALFQVEPPRRGAVHIRIPTTPIAITRVGGSETMTVSNWTISSNAQPIGGNRYRVTATLEPFEFRVGGTLSASANQAEGTYTGTFDVTVEYP